MKCFDKRGGDEELFDCYFKGKLILCSWKIEQRASSKSSSRGLILPFHAINNWKIELQVITTKTYPIPHFSSEKTDFFCDPIELNNTHRKSVIN